MQRVIALNGVLDDAEKSPKPRASDGKDQLASESAPQQPQPAIDLAATALEWGAQHHAATQRPASMTETAVGPRIEPVAPDKPLEDFSDAQWATYSSIAMRPLDDSPLSQRILSAKIEDAVTMHYDPVLPQRVLHANIEDAVTMHYDPATATPDLSSPPTIVDLAGLDRALESAGVPRDGGFVLPPPAPAPQQPVAAEPVKLLVIPASLAWIVLGAFALCALTLVYLITSFAVCHQSFALDPRTLHCVAPADVASTR